VLFLVPTSMMTTSDQVFWKVFAVHVQKDIRAYYNQGSKDALMLLVLEIVCCVSAA